MSLYLIVGELTLEKVSSVNSFKFYISCYYVFAIS